MFADVRIIIFLQSSTETLFLGPGCSSSHDRGHLALMRRTKMNVITRKQRPNLHLGAAEFNLCGWRSEVRPASG
jgi:hypothetical protein